MYYTSGWRPLLAGLAMVVAGCGGAGDDDRIAPNTPSPPVSAPPASAPQVTNPTGRGTVIVTATDALGAPLAGASVTVFSGWGGEDKRAVTDVNGVAEVNNMLAYSYSVSVSAPSAYGLSPSRTLKPSSVDRVSVTAWPRSQWSTGGIARASIPDDGISADGRSLRVSLEILQVPAEQGGEYWSLQDAVRILPCVPEPANDLPRFQPDCIAGADGFDAGYGVPGTFAHAQSIEYALVSITKAAKPLFAALLLDQGADVAVVDPEDRRLFAAKYFLDFARGNGAVALAAFSANDPATGQPSLLPERPVTVFPVENPTFTDSGRTLFPLVDSLAQMEGGNAPLIAAVDRMLDFVAAADVRDGQRALVVLTNGRDPACAARSDCQAALDAIVQKSRSSGVAVVTVGLADANGTADLEALGLLAQGAEGSAAFWARQPDQIATSLGAAAAYLAGTKGKMLATFTITSTVPGAFSSGRTVLGQVQLEVCSLDCVYTDIPFAVRIP